MIRQAARLAVVAALTAVLTAGMAALPADARTTSESLRAAYTVPYAPCSSWAAYFSGACEQYEKRDRPLAAYKCAYGSFVGAPPDFDGCLHYKLAVYSGSKHQSLWHAREIYKRFTSNQAQLQLFWAYAAWYGASAAHVWNYYGFIGGVVTCEYAGTVAGWLAGLGCGAVYEGFFPEMHPSWWG